MRKKILWFFSKLMNIITIIITSLFALINFENLTCYFSFNFSGIIDPSKSLNVRYHYLIKDIYGEEKGFEICWKIEDFTIWIIEHHINLILFAVISIMMLLCIWMDKKLNQKLNKALKVYFIMCLVIMWIATFVAGPFYKQLIYE